MIIQTSQFGELELLPESIITFHQGLPGFESLRQFSLVTPDSELPFSVLQSIEEADTAFILTNPFLFYPNYEFDVPEEVQQLLRIEHVKEVAVWSIVSIGEELASSTLNLLAPLLINVRERVGKQCILHGGVYTTKHPITVPKKTISASEVGEAHARIDT